MVGVSSTQVPARKKRRILPDWLMNPKPGGETFDVKILVDEEDPDAENPLEEEKPGAENEEEEKEEENPDAENRNTEPVVASPRVTKQLSRLEFSKLLTNSSILRLGSKSKPKSKPKKGNKKIISHTVGQRKITSFIHTKKSESTGGGIGAKTGEPQAMAIVQENDSHNSLGNTSETFKNGSHQGNPHFNTDASTINYYSSEEGDKYPETSQQNSDSSACSSGGSACGSDCGLWTVDQPGQPVQPYQARQKKSNRT